MRLKPHPGLALAALLALLPRTGDATWSIIVVDLRTKEIAIGSATCVEGYDLRVVSPVVLVGVGAAAAQSYVDTTGANRLLIRDQFRLGTSPQQILALLALQDPAHQYRQYGIVDVLGRKAGFTGTQAGPYAGDLVGQIGDLHYAIQGNVLTGAPVNLMAEQAIRTTPGDLPAKLMAAMQVARAFGGRARSPNRKAHAMLGFRHVSSSGSRSLS